MIILQTGSESRRHGPRRLSAGGRIVHLERERHSIRLAFSVDIWSAPSKLCTREIR